MKVSIYANERENSQEVKAQLLKRLQAASVEIDDEYPDIVFTIGGDGTVLHAVHHYLYLIETVKFIGNSIKRKYH